MTDTRVTSFHHQGSDSTLLQKLTATHGKNALYVKPKPMSDKFGIQHFAGLVSYITEGERAQVLPSFFNIIDILSCASLPPFVVSRICTLQGTSRSTSREKTMVITFMINQ